MILSLSGFAQNGQAVEDPTVRRALDQLLMRKGHIVVEDVAFTIFPQRLWKMSPRRPDPPFRPLSRDIPALAGDQPQGQWPRHVFRTNGHVRARPVRR